MPFKITSVEEAVNEKNQLTHTVTYLCWGGEWPGFLIGHYNGRGFLKNVRAVPYGRGEDETWWEYQYTYGPPEEGQSNNNPDKNPLLEPMKVQMGSRMLTIPVEKDAEGENILNSLGDRFQDLIQVETANTLISVSKNRGSDASYLFNYAGCVNADPFIGCGKDTLRFIEPQQQSQWDDRIGTYWTVGVTLEFNPRKWNPTEYLDCGFRYKDKEGKIKKHDGASPVLLDGKGGKNKEGGKPHYLKFNHYERCPFQQLFQDF